MTAVRFFQDARAIESLRESDFDTVSAYGEVIDNSLEAGATEVKVKFVTEPKRGREQILSLAFGDLEGGAGLQGSFQENVYRGYSLLPNYRSFSGGVLAYERLSLPQVDLEFGARYDTLFLVTVLLFRAALLVQLRL